MVPSHRRALRARLLSFRYIDGIDLDWVLLATLEMVRDKVTAGLNPAGPATLARMRRRNALERQRELFGGFKGRGTDAPFAQVAREVFRVAVHGVHLVGA